MTYRAGPCPAADLTEALMQQGIFTITEEAKGTPRSPLLVRKQLHGGLRSCQAQAAPARLRVFQP
eukprot:CAMPEP_0172864366 /NCGR_PEP_ID=MMETSP1075-20121228/80055_1 /TAXON_ID=2916 /ORGANISM="Ceratium fusus, Strain PA161109" /LENGTH=64 /DNA_ID=CAMNT_0013713239 /DNA_START=386 /DNA_END=580 /DNA_ORIENTATION=-